MAKITKIHLILIPFKMPRGFPAIIAEVTSVILTRRCSTLTCVLAILILKKHKIWIYYSVNIKVFAYLSYDLPTHKFIFQYKFKTHNLSFYNKKQQTHMEKRWDKKNWTYIGLWHFIILSGYVIYESIREISEFPLLWSSKIALNLGNIVGWIYVTLYVLMLRG